jgi:hypothetical protein
VDESSTIASTIWLGGGISRRSGLSPWNLGTRADFDAVTERLARRSWGWLILSAIGPLVGTTFFFIANVLTGPTVWATIFAVLALAAYCSVCLAVVIMIRTRSNWPERD